MNTELHGETLVEAQGIAERYRNRCIDLEHANASLCRQLLEHSDEVNRRGEKMTELQAALEKEWIKNGELREQIERLKDNRHPCRICGDTKFVMDLPEDQPVPCWLCNAPANYAHQHAHDEPANDRTETPPTGDVQQSKTL